MTPMEWLALDNCRGSVVDVGAAAGCHTLILQQKGFNITAIDKSPGAGTVLKQRGVKKPIITDIYSYQQKTFDTILMLMNGIGLASTIDGLVTLLKRLKLLLNPGGQILFDSSDVSYLFAHGELLPAHYYGEIDYEYVYKNESSGWFKWLYVDKDNMERIAGTHGFDMELMYEDDHAQYLARLIATNKTEDE